MKKIAKLSLVAAVAVAGLTTTASAGSLEAAVKNTDISGKFRYRLHNVDKAGATSTDTDVEIEVGAKVKVTDTVKAVFKIDNAPNFDSAKGSNGNDTLDIEDYYFSYNNAGLTVNFGQQNIPTRQVDGGQGDGIVALTKLGGFTVGGAYFFHNNVAKSAVKDNDILSVLATGNVGPANVLAQYSSVNDYGTALNLRAAAKVAMINASLEMATVDLDNDNADYGTTKLGLGGKIGGVALGLTHVTTEKGGSGSLDSGAEAASELTGFQVHSAGRKDLAYTVVKATVPVAAKTSVTLYYGTGEEGTTDVNETFVQATYKAAKNLTAYLRHGMSEVGTTDTDKTRLEVQYSF